MALAGGQHGAYTRAAWSSPRMNQTAEGQHASFQLSVPPLKYRTTSRVVKNGQTCRPHGYSRAPRTISQDRLRMSQAVASSGTGSIVEEVEEADIANRNPFLEGDFEIGDDEEWEEVPLHRVKIHHSKEGRTIEVDVPEDRYMLHSAEEQGYDLPFACRMGCCTSCAVRVKSGKLYQPLALGISNELKAQGYALMCVAYPLSDLEVETQDEDEVYWMQFGKYFARGPIERDDIALEIALQDE